MSDTTDSAIALRCFAAIKAADEALHNGNVNKGMHKALVKKLKDEVKELMQPPPHKKQRTGSAASSGAASSTAALADEPDHDDDAEARRLGPAMQTAAKQVQIPWPCQNPNDCEEAYKYKTFQQGREAVATAFDENTLFEHTGGMAHFSTARSHKPKGSGVPDRGVLDWEFIDGSSCRYHRTYIRYAYDMHTIRT